MSEENVEIVRRGLERADWEAAECFWDYAESQAIGVTRYCAVDV